MMSLPPDLVTSESEMELAKALMLVDTMSEDEFDQWCVQHLELMNAIDQSDLAIECSLFTHIPVTSLRGMSTRTSSSRWPTLARVRAISAQPSRTLPAPGKSQLQCICEELMDTEKRYGHSIGMLQRHFATQLSPSLAKDFLPNLSSLVDLSARMQEGMAAAMAEHEGTMLAHALGVRLAELAPFFKLFVAYCSAFPRAMQSLRTMPSLEKAIAAAESSILAESADGSQVSIFGLLIKPVQRLCQYPLLFREVVQAASASCYDIGEDANAEMTAQLEEVQQLLERAAGDVNERVRGAEVESRLWNELSGTDWRQQLVGKCSSSALALQAEIPVEIVARRRSVTITRSLSFQRRKQYSAGRQGKLFLFANALIVAKREGGGDTTRMKVMAVWSLFETSLGVSESDASINKETITLRHLDVEGDPESHSDGSFSLRCSLADAARISQLFEELKHGNRRRSRLAMERFSSVSISSESEPP